MSRRRFYAQPSMISGSTVDLSPEETHHLVRVLRMKAGDEAFIFDGCGFEYRCRLASLRGDNARLEIIETLGGEVESPVRITLAQALAKGEKFDFIVQKATELGVSAILPLVTDHADVKLDERGARKRVERWRRVSLEALKQSGRRRLVEISAPLTLEQFFDAGGGTPGPTLVFSERGGGPIAGALGGTGRMASVAAVIGPEGGWSDGELELLGARAASIITLGPRVLRAETAAIVAITLLQHALGDLSN